ncbi:hypothetical protein SCL_1799 [Sulfuricaulis limicola]|uniref:Uncharacterized protein n=1 Tax=Sulfuricaulis limicola TaxID=1620215 RepID=A0A1B4XH46_9GAMM|nr:hypothetical protein SCL_1799 [Sulfuricaulis limicola]
MERQLMQPIFDAPALRDIARNRRGAYNSAGLVSDGRKRQGNTNPLAILTDTFRFVTFNLFASAATLEERPYFIGSIARKKHGDRAAYRRRGGVAEKAFGGRIPGKDNPL